MECYKSHNMIDRQWDRAGQPHINGHLPGYTGYCPGSRYSEGLTFGAMTERANKKIRDELESQFSEPRGPKCTAVPRYSTCHGLPMAVYRERPQTGTVFANKADMDNLIDSLAWYSKSSKDRASKGNNRILPHRYRLRVYNESNKQEKNRDQNCELASEQQSRDIKNQSRDSQHRKTSSGTQSEMSCTAAAVVRSRRVKC